MRKQLLGVFLPLFIVSFMVAAETGTTGTATTAQAASKQAAVRSVDVVRGDDGVSIEITATGQLEPKLSTLDRPNRVVLDLPNTVAATSRRNLAVDSDGVKGVRLGMDGQGTTRVVVDLDRKMAYDLEPGTGKLVLKLHAGTVAKAVAPPVKPVVSTVAEAKAPAPVATTAASESKLLAAVPTKPATEFAFVEPTYSPKDSKAESPASNVIAPPARVIEAAAKFSDKPAEALVPKASASLQQQATGAAPAVNMAAEQKTEMAHNPSTNGPKYTGEPISVNLKDVDLKDFFRLIHEIS